MDWDYGDRYAMPKRRLFTEQKNRLTDPTIRHTDQTVQKSLIRQDSNFSKVARTSSTEPKHERDVRPDKHMRQESWLANTTCTDIENQRPESKVDASAHLNVQRLDCQSLGLFLRRLGLEEYEELFEEHQVAAEDLPTLNRDDLADMGLPIGPRNRILAAIKAEDKYDPPQDSRRKPNSYRRASLGDSSSKSTVRQQLQQEVEQFISVINSSEVRSKQKPPLTPELNHVERPRDSTDTMFRLIEDLTKRQELMIKAMEQNAQALRTLANLQQSSQQSRAPSPGIVWPRSESMKRV